MKTVTLAKALSSETRLKILQILAKDSFHISGLARHLNISVPVTARHVEYLEGAGLIKRRRYGRTHILELESFDKLISFTDGLIEPIEIEVEEDTNLLEALKKTSAIKFKKTKEGSLVISIDGEPGYYVYEVDGHMPKKPLAKYQIRDDAIVKMKKLVPTTRKSILVRVRKGKQSPSQKKKT
jgi:DNA-binding transcriptional ArsR family regulator